MAPIQDTVVEDLKNTVARLEKRLAEMEQRLGGGSSSSSSQEEGVRMILMGPPGAGKCWLAPKQLLTADRTC
jgi:adenylate kinase